MKGAWNKVIKPVGTSLGNTAGALVGVPNAGTLGAQAVAGIGKRIAGYGDRREKKKLGLTRGSNEKKFTNAENRTYDQM